MSHSSGQTSLYSVKKAPFKWCISNFSYCSDEAVDFMQSSPFPLGTSDQKWCLRIYPGGIDAASKNYISLLLMLVSSNKPVVRATFELNLLNANNESGKTRKFRRLQTFVLGRDLGYKKFISRNYLFNRSNQLLPNDVITISCEVTVLLNPHKLCIAAQSDQIQKPLADTKLPKHLEDLFENQKLTDVTFYIEGKELKSHKAILTSRSAVFRAMFRVDMQERLTNRVEIIDIKYNVFKAMLHFIYTDKAPNRNMAIELLVAADKYALNRLKALCEKEIIANITTENSAQMLILADLHNCHLLKGQILEFIGIGAKIVMETAGWKSMEKTHPDLISEAYEELMRRKIK